MLNKKQKSILISLGTSLTVLYFISNYFDWTIFDYEYFGIEELIALYIVIYGLDSNLLAAQTKDTNIHIADDHFHIDKQGTKHQLAFHDIDGISRWFDNAKLFLKNGKGITIRKSKTNNFGVIEKFYDGSKGIKALPFYLAASIRNYLFCLFILLTILLTFFFVSGNKHKLYPYLPLQSIRVITIEGTIQGKGDIPNDFSLRPYLKHDADSKAGKTTGSFLLKEYLGKSFSLPHAYHLKNKTLNFNETIKFKKDTPARIKIRSRDLEKLTGENNSYLPSSSISCYYLEVDDVILFEKERLVDEQTEK